MYLQLDRNETRQGQLLVRKAAQCGSPRNGISVSSQLLCRLISSNLCSVEGRDGKLCMCADMCSPWQGADQCVIGNHAPTI